MDNHLEILNSLTEAQKKEFEKDLQELWVHCDKHPLYSLASQKDVTGHMNLLDEVYLKYTFEFDPHIAGKAKGRIMELFKYPNKLSYMADVEEELKRDI
jgi:hypothetical protein